MTMQYELIPEVGEASSNRGKEDAMAPHNDIFACVIRQYGTGLFRSCILWQGKDAICLSEHADERSANETLHRFLEAFREKDMTSLEEISLLATSLTEATMEPPAAYLPK
jgi:hypothetical protein